MPTYESIKYKFSGTAITGVMQEASAGTNANGARTVSTSSPSGGSDGDVWYKYS